MVNLRNSFKEAERLQLEVDLENVQRRANEQAGNKSAKSLRSHFKKATKSIMLANTAAKALSIDSFDGIEAKLRESMDRAQELCANYRRGEGPKAVDLLKESLAENFRRDLIYLDAFALNKRRKSAFTNLIGFSNRELGKNDANSTSLLAQPAPITAQFEYF